MAAYKGFVVPGGADPANVPQIMRDFVDSLDQEYASTAAADTAGVPDNVIVNVAGRMMFRTGATWNYVSPVHKSSGQTAYPSSVVQNDLRVVEGAHASDLEVYDPDAIENPFNSGWYRTPGVSRYQAVDQLFVSPPALNTGETQSSTILEFQTRQTFWMEIGANVWFEVGTIAAGGSAYVACNFALQHSINGGAFSSLPSPIVWEESFAGFLSPTVAKRTTSAMDSVKCAAGNHRFRILASASAVLPNTVSLRVRRFHLSVTPKYEWRNM